MPAGSCASSSSTSECTRASSVPGPESRVVMVRSVTLGPVAVPTRIGAAHDRPNYGALVFPGAYVGDAPDRPAVIMAGSGQVQTYRQLDDAANQLSRVLYEAGLRPGDHVALCMENHPRYLEALWGCRYAGLVYTACSSPPDGRRARLHRRRLWCAGDDRLGGDGRRSAAGDPRRHAAGRAPTRRRRHRSTATAATRTRSPRSRPTPLPDRIAGTDMLYSSGTTGQPKGVMPAFTPSPLEQQGGSIAGLLGGAVRVHDGRPSTSARRRCTTPRRCASRWRCTPSAARRS